MARQVNVTIIDDLDGKTKAEETVEFSIDGVNYEIDLSTKNAEKLRAELGKWVDSARRVTGRFKGRRPIASPGRREDLAAVREWARNNGFKVSSRGRIPADVVSAFRNALKSDSAVDKPEFSEAN